ncbi:MAG: hypothetical protein C0622_12725 [Desulfuromonas sp.]|nr:MAG: hypothetical protein C0622_12725 [Desulfuromonas sp.]
MKSTPFYKKAAYFCIAAPFIADFVLTVTKTEAHQNQLSNNITLFVASLLIFSGILLGTISIIKSEKKKSIYIPATIGVICNILVVLIAYATFNELRNGASYFEIEFSQSIDGYEYKEMIYGKVPKKIDIKDIVKQISMGVIKVCPDCTITKTNILKSLPEELDGIFESRPIKFSYVALDALDGSNIKARNIFPNMDPQPSCDDLEEYINLKKAGVGNFASVTCSEAI